MEFYQFVILTAFRNEKFRLYMGVPDYLPGTKLERMQSNYVREEAMKMKQENVKVLTHKPKTLEGGGAQKKAKGVKVKVGKKKVPASDKRAGRNSCERC